MTDVTQVLTHKGSILYYVGDVAGAPVCDCEERSVLLIAQTKSGRLFSMYVCPKGVSDGYKDKCEFKQFAQEGPGFTMRRLA